MGLRRSVSLPISLHPFEAVLEELHLEMLSDQQPGVSLEGSLTSHLQARQLEVSQAQLSAELLVPVLAMLLPTGSATSSVEVARAERGVREAKVVRLLVSLGAREERVARAREGRVGRTFLEASTAREKEERESAEVWMSLSLKSGSLVEFLEHLAEAWLVGL